MVIEMYGKIFRMWITVLLLNASILLHVLERSVETEHIAVMAKDHKQMIVMRKLTED